MGLKLKLVRVCELYIVCLLASLWITPQYIFILIYNII